MQTPLLPITPDTLERAARCLREGGLVAFPTETVYGLGASALDAEAVERIFVAKGRPAHNPVIVHVAGASAARALVADWPESADRLAGQFWPGPLTLVLPRSTAIPDIVTAGGPTVALRVPAHPVALALLQAAGVPVAAPSANRSSRLSPTTAAHVARDLDGRIDLILDGGPTQGGIESTVLDLTTDPPRLLRPGLVTLAELEALLGPVAVGTPSPSAVLASPGLLRRHYAPRTPLVVAEESLEIVHRLIGEGKRVGWVTLGQPEAVPAGVEVEALPADAAGYAAGLYAALHRLDEVGLDRIVVARPPAGGEWLAIQDRLRRAAEVE